MVVQHLINKHIIITIILPTPIFVNNLIQHFKKQERVAYIYVLSSISVVKSYSKAFGM